MPAMLRECYIAEVMRRRMQFIDDEATQSHIEKAAKWLTGNHKPGLLLHGTVGNGKTTLVRAIGSLIGYCTKAYIQTGVKMFWRYRLWNLQT